MLASMTVVTAAVKDVMYHVTRKANLPSIKKYGLLPAKKPSGFSKGKGQWKRNSLYFTSTPQGAKNWLLMLSSDADNLNESEAQQFCILKVDVSKWKSKFKEDPDFEVSEGDKTDAYYIQNTSIPPENILRVLQPKRAISTLKKEDSYVFWQLVKPNTFTTKELTAKLTGLDRSLLPKIRKELNEHVKRKAQFYENYPSEKKTSAYRDFKRGSSRLDEILTQLGH